MARVIVGMAMSLDGFINDQSGSVAALYRDFDTMRDTEPMRESIQNTGAVVMGRHAFAMAEDPDSYADNYEFQVPIFVLTHEEPKRHPKETDKLTFTFVTDGIESAMEKAKTAAGDKYVTVVGGANTFQQCINKMLFDELEIDLVPILLGGGLRLFEHIIRAEHIRLEGMKVVESPGVTHLRYRVVKES
jgi:dihydrofolate reductase